MKYVNQTVMNATQKMRLKLQKSVVEKKDLTIKKDIKHKEMMREKENMKSGSPQYETEF